MENYSRFVRKEPETKEIVVPATHHLAGWEHGERSAGDAFTWAGCIGRHVSVVVVVAATSHVAARYREAGKTS